MLIDLGKGFIAGDCVWVGAEPSHYSRKIGERPGVFRVALLGVNRPNEQQIRALITAWREKKRTLHPEESDAVILADALDAESPLLW